MAADYITEMQEQEDEEKNYRNIIDEAAYYVVNQKMSRENAYEHSTNLHEQRQDKENYVVTNEETGEIEYLHAELKEPIFEKTKQIKAVADELFDKFE